jgi:hypothetical protein
MPQQRGNRWGWCTIEKRSAKIANQALGGQMLQNAEEIIKFLKSETNKYHVAHANVWVHINNVFGMFKLMRWIDPNHSTMKLFVTVIACTKYVLSPTKTLPCSNAMKFHVFVLCV